MMIHSNSSFHKNRPGRIRQSPFEKRQVIAGSLLCGFIVAAVGLAVFALYGYLSQSQFFQITSIPIEGNKMLQEQEILKLSGIDIRSNLMAISQKQIREKLKKNEWIEDVVLKRHWPDQLVIKIREKKPVALLNTSKGLFYLDERGNPFTPYIAGQEMDFPVITGIQERWIALRQKDNPASPLMRAVAFIKRAGKKNAILPAQRISEIHITRDNTLNLHLLDRPFPIMLGEGESTRTLLRRLVYILKDLHRNREFDQIASINMNYTEDTVLVSSINHERVN
jgi:cell division protein FtsQ